MQKEIHIILAICTLMIGLSQKVYYSVEEVQLYRFSKSLLDFVPMVGYLFLLFPIIVAVARVLPFEYEQKMMELLATYKYGRKIFLLVKLIVLFCYCAFIVFYFFLVAGIISYFFYGLDNWMLDIESIGYMYIDLGGEWRVWEVLAFEYVYLLLSTFTFVLCLFLVAQFVRRSIFIMLIGGATFLVVELFDKYVTRFINHDYINLIIKYSFNRLVNFEFLNVFTFPQLFIGLIIGMLLLIIVNILVEGITVND